MTKRIRPSKRGLTFAFDETEHLPIGKSLSYTVDVKGNRIIIHPAKTQDNTISISRKRSGRNFKALIDIRNRSVRKLCEKAEYLNVVISDEYIYVTAYNVTAPAADQQRSSGAAINIEENFSIREASSFLLPKSSLLPAADDTGTIQTKSLSFQIDEDLPYVYKVLSLFSGAGMLDYPFSLDPEFEIIYAVDNNPAAVISYQHNIGNHIECKDITEVNGQLYGQADVVIGGISCTPFSNANRHTRLSAHKDSNLFQEFAQIVKDSRAKVFVLENVPAFLTAENGAYLYELMESLGMYHISTSIVEDSNLGGYTKRKRAIVLGSILGSCKIPSLITNAKRTVKEALVKVSPSWFNYSDVTTPGNETKKRMSYVPPGGNWKSIPEDLRTGQCTLSNKHSNSYYRLDPDQQSPSIVNWRKPPLIHPFYNRTLSVSEASALSGFDSDFRFYGTLAEKQQQCGNGVPYAIGSFIKNLIKDHLNFFNQQYVSFAL